MLLFLLLVPTSFSQFCIFAFSDAAQFDDIPLTGGAIINATSPYITVVYYTDHPTEF